MFAVMDEEEKLLYGLFLNSGMRDAEMQNTEYADFNWEKCTLHVQPKPWRHFRLKGKKKKKSAKDRFIPIPAKLLWKIKDRMRERNAQPQDLVFPNGNGNPDGHFLRKLKAIAKKASIEGAELHRFRKTYADTLHEEGMSVNTIRIRLGHESLDVTLATSKAKMLSRKKHRNTPIAVAWHCTHKLKDIHDGRFLGSLTRDLPFSSLAAWLRLAVMRGVAP